MTAPVEVRPADVLLADGSIAVVRALRQSDGPALHDLHESVSDEAIRMRFFSSARHAAHRYVDTMLASESTLALVAEARGELLGLATAEPLDAATAEVAFLVADAARGRGVGTLLLEHVAALASAQGFTRFEADVLTENHAMLSVFARAGYVEGRDSDSGVVMLRLATRAGSVPSARADERDFRAEARSLRPLLRPRAVAVVGAGPGGTDLGAAVLDQVLGGVLGRAATRGPDGRVVVVHPTAAEVAGVATTPSLAAAGEVDLVLVCVPEQDVVEAVREAGAAGAGAAVIVSPEPAPPDSAGRRELLAAARAAGVRLVGPDSLGVLLAGPERVLNATYQQVVPPPGGLAIASQSGGVGAALLRRADEAGLGVHSLVALGAKVDVSSNDLLAAWYDDEEVRAAGLYLQSFGNAAKFARFARRFSRRKPLLAVVGGRAPGADGERRPGGLRSVGVDALFAQSGVLGCRDVDDLVETARLLAEQPLPAGGRVAVLGNTGGTGVLVADAARAEGLVVPELSAALQERLRPLLAAGGAPTNPVDAGVSATPEQLGRLLDEVLDSGEVDAAVLVPVATALTDAAATVRALGEARARHPQLPVLAVPVGLDLATTAGPGGTTVHATPAAAVGSLAHAVRYAAWLADEEGPGAPLTDAAEAARTRSLARDLLRRGSSGWSDGSDVAALLAAYGLAAVGTTARSATGAARAAGALGLPVAVKVVDAGTVRRAEAGLVRTGLRTREQVRDAYRDFAGSVGGAPEVLVQPMVSGTEVALGVVRDPTLGPLVTVASGGVPPGLRSDQVILVAPVTEADARRAVGSLRSTALLAADGGGATEVLEPVVGLLVSLGRLVTDVPEVAELVLDAVVPGPGAGCQVVDAKLRLGTPLGPDPTAPRQLRSAD
ncbi:GNAT family N-acetyltransferase [Nocardioides sp. zg-579]|uniref:GNAT family N-acetyltransferase n=1 Tax=Nocardioides marmotae TaxID=2663857 RepID=A0A6I3JER8_9ACTN|nr:GNAT family N-acetyltransferase [Nocardioides marmotae]MCR6032873.1 GNAT family N-acetyltransferase [Gordonia jinghuaiqii]MTB96523.1 GNAT family N-acetyltransferase [Nocardioides marmotae]QKE01956.1 GNAT family N-acetyltransferase [Nocardioides marmotae]